MSYTEELLYEMRSKKAVPSLEKIAKEVAQEAKKKKEQQALIKKQAAGKEVEPEELLKAGGIKIEKSKEKKKVAYIAKDAAGDYKKEEEVRRLFAASLLKNKKIFEDRDKLTEAFDGFAAAGREGRKKFVYMVTATLSPKKIKKFMKKLLKNPDKDSMELFDKFSKKHRKTIRFAEEAREEMGEALAADAADVAYRRMMDFMAAKKLGVPLSERRKTIFIDDEGKEVVEEVVVSKTGMKKKGDLTCINDYAFRLWIPGYISTWLSAAPGEELDKSFVIGNKLMTLDDRTFFKANKKFDLLMCSSYSFMNHQVNNVFVAYDDKKKEHHFIVGHLIKTGAGESLSIQDEKVFQDEQNYFKRMKASLRELVREFLNTPMSDDAVRSTASEIFRKQLVNAILPLAKKLNPSFTLSPSSESVLEFDEKARKLSDKGTIRDYARVYARIIGPLVTEDFIVYTKDIMGKIADGVYDVDTLVDIPTDLLFAEIFRNPRITPKTLETGQVFDPRIALSESADKLTDEYTTVLGSLVYKAFNPYTGTLAVRTITPALKRDEYVVDMDVICTQKGIPSSKRVYYLDKEDGNLYCFDVTAILARTGQDTFKNPFTGREFSPEFIEEISRVSVDYITKDLFGEEEEEVQEVAAEMPIDVELVKEDGSVYIRALIATIKEDETGFIEDDSVPTGEKCKYCTETIQNPIFRTVVKYGDDSTVLQFCNAKCFTDWDEPSDDEDFEDARS